MWAAGGAVAAAATKSPATAAAVAAVATVGPRRLHAIDPAAQPGAAAGLAAAPLGAAPAAAPLGAGRGPAAAKPASMRVLCCDGTPNRTVGAVPEPVVVLAGLGGLLLLKRPDKKLSLERCCVKYSFIPA